MASSKTKSLRCILKLTRPLAVANRGGQIVAIPGTETFDVFRAKQPPHRDLANMWNDEKAAAKFVSAWGAVTVGAVSDFEGSFLGPAHEAAEELRKRNPGVNRFLFHTHELIRQYRDTLRAAWKGDKTAIESMRKHLASQASGWAFSHGQIELDAPEAWSVICVLFLRDYEAGKTAVCEHPDCLTPYFIRKRSTQKFCEAGPCVEYGARLRANKWWDAHGNDWRAEKQKASGKRGK